MKIVTVNVPESYLNAIEKLIGEGGLYPSRSELIRVAVREFILKELKNANDLLKYKDVEVEDFDDRTFVKVPEDKKDSNGDIVREYKTYRIIKRLEY